MYKSITTQDGQNFKIKLSHILKLYQAKKISVKRYNQNKHGYNLIISPSDYIQYADQQNQRVYSSNPALYAKRQALVNSFN
jgi:hypothetical protein